jgi:hypothetical protein
MHTQIPNDEHCSSCRATVSGELIYCDGCPRAFHLWCLDPPVETPDVGKWFCPGCAPRKVSPSSSFLHFNKDLTDFIYQSATRQMPDWIVPAVRNLDSGIPSEFQLPEDIRGFFKDGNG